MDVSLLNSILLDSLMLDPEPVDLCALRAWHPDVDIAKFTEMICELEIAELVESKSILCVSITQRGKAHLAALVATSMISRSGEDLGDVSDHLLREIPQPEGSEGMTHGRRHG